MGFRAVREGVLGVCLQCSLRPAPAAARGAVGIDEFLRREAAVKRAFKSQALGPPFHSLGEPSMRTHRCGLCSTSRERVGKSFYNNRPEVAVEHGVEHVG